MNPPFRVPASTRIALIVETVSADYRCGKAATHDIKAREQERTAIRFRGSFGSATRRRVAFETNVMTSDAGTPRTPTALRGKYGRFGEDGIPCLNSADAEQARRFNGSQYENINLSDCSSRDRGSRDCASVGGEGRAGS